MAIIPIKNEAHWHELRKKNVGGSEVAALFNECSYMTKLELWLIKRGEVSGDIEDNSRMFWGRMVEEAIAQGVAKTKGWVVDNPHGYFTCDDTPGMGCTPDRILPTLDGKGTGLLQIKNVDWLEYKKWEDGQPPLSKQIQLQHELGCAGYSWGALAVLVGGNDLKLFTYDAHAKTIAKIKRAITEFWQTVQANEMPKATGDDYEILREYYSDYIGEIDLTGDNQLPSLCADVLAAAERRKAAEKEEKTAKAAILEKIGNASKALCAGFDIRRKQVSKAEYTVKAQSYSQLTIKEQAA